MIWELVSQIDILMMLEKSFPYVVFFELRDFGHAVYQWRKGFHTQGKGAPQRRQIAVDRGILIISCLFLIDEAYNVLGFELCSLHRSKRGFEMQSNPLLG